MPADDLTPERLVELREEYTGYDLRLRSSRVGGTMRVGELLTLISAAEERDRLRAENEAMRKRVAELEAVAHDLAHPIDMDKGTSTLVLYFGSEADRNDFVAIWKAEKPNSKTVKL